MRVVINKEVGSAKLNYPDEVSLFISLFDVPSGDGALVCDYLGTKTLEELSGVYLTIEYLGGEPTTGIRTITTGSMQTRFSITEEVSIVDGTDSIAKVLLSRLFNAKNINLDLQELIEGLVYITNYLDSQGVTLGGVGASVRLDQLLQDGTADEAYS